MSNESKRAEASVVSEGSEKRPRAVCVPERHRIPESVLVASGAPGIVTSPGKQVADRGWRGSECGFHECGV